MSVADYVGLGFLCVVAILVVVAQVVTDRAHRKVREMEMRDHAEARYAKMLDDLRSFSRSDR